MGNDGTKTFDLLGVAKYLRPVPEKDGLNTTSNDALQSLPCTADETILENMLRRSAGHDSDPANALAIDQGLRNSFDNPLLTRVTTQLALGSHGALPEQDTIDNIQSHHPTLARESNASSSKYSIGDSVLSENLPRLTSADKIKIPLMVFKLKAHDTVFVRRSN